MVLSKLELRTFATSLYATVRFWFRYSLSEQALWSRGVKLSEGGLGGLPPSRLRHNVGVQGAGAPWDFFWDFRGLLIRFYLTESAQKHCTIVIRQSLNQRFSSISGSINNFTIRYLPLIRLLLSGIFCEVREEVLLSNSSILRSTGRSTPVKFVNSKDYFFPYFD